MTALNATLFTDLGETGSDFKEKQFVELASLLAFVPSDLQ